jgi:hypothetical protein
MGTVDERVGQNEAIFRQVNERIAELGEHYQLGVLEIVCECADMDCVERITLPVADYEAARRDDAMFIVVAEHVDRRVEQVTFEGHGFVFVRKNGDAAEAAREADAGD